MIMPWGIFKQALKDANPRLCVRPKDGALGAMIYLRRPGSEDVLPGTDLEEVLAVASPSFFTTGCPVQDVAVRFGEHPTVAPGKVKWVRGAGSVFRRMAKMREGGRPLMDARRMRQLYPTLFHRVNANKFKQEILAPNAEPEGDLRKKAKWLKDRSKPIPGDGMPLGWKPTKIISGGDERCSTPGGLL